MVNKKKSKKKVLLNSNSLAVKSKPTKENPFEAIWTKRKFDILGKKRKGEEVRIGFARSRAIEKRKKTLLKEYEQSGKSSVFLDKRIGEKNDTLEEFDKAILRFQHERHKVRRKTKYNLSDGDEDDFNPSAMDDFEEQFSEDDNPNIIDSEKNYLSLNQGDDVNYKIHTKIGLDEKETKRRSKKEVMEEIIKKSKFYKAEKAKDKEEGEHLMEELDKNFISLTQSEMFCPLTQPNTKNSLKAFNNSVETSLKMTTTSNKESSKEEKADAYDKLVKEMVLDMRARPSDRTKTPVEIAQEEREHLELLEEQRKKRMLATDSSDESDNEVDKGLELLKRPISTSGDDLGDSFSADQNVPHKKGWVDEILEREKDENHENEVNASFEAESDTDDGSRDGSIDDDDEGESDWEQSDQEDLNDEPKDEKMVGKSAKRLKENGEENECNEIVTPPHFSKVKVQEVLPYVIEAPSNPQQLSSLLDSCSNAEILEAITRIRKCNAISLATENRKKMQVFYGLLFQYFAVLPTKRPLDVTRLNLLVKPLMEMSIDTPYFAAICARERIIRLRSRFCDDVQNSGKLNWPSLKTLVLLRLWSLIFPCSDFRHVVMTPVILLMCEYLMRCPITSGKDVAVGCFLSSMILFVGKQSKKLYPEVIVFLQTLLLSALDSEQADHQNSWHHHLVELGTVKPWLHISDPLSDIVPLEFYAVMDLPADCPYFSSDEFRVGILVSVIETLRGFVLIYDGFNAFPELFMPIHGILTKILNQKSLPESLKDKMADVSQLIRKITNERYIFRRPIQMRKQKPVPIKLLNPKFEENFVKGRDYDPDRERVERKKLKKLLKQESKGAVRELRKDNHFLFAAKEKERVLLEQERAEKYGKAMAFLQEQEHAFKSGQLGKGRKRRK